MMMMTDNGELEIKTLYLLLPRGRVVQGRVQGLVQGLLAMVASVCCEAFHATAIHRSFVRLVGWFRQLHG